MSGIDFPDGFEPSTRDCLNLAKRFGWRPSEIDRLSAEEVALLIAIGPARDT